MTVIPQRWWCSGGDSAGRPLPRNIGEALTVLSDAAGALANATMHNDAARVGYATQRAAVVEGLVGIERYAGALRGWLLNHATWELALGGSRVSPCPDCGYEGGNWEDLLDHLAHAAREREAIE